MSSQNHARQNRPADASSLLQLFSDRQYTRPHMTLAEAVVDVAGSAGCCGLVTDRAIQWLDLEPTTRIGRLRRTELSQLARSIHRMWLPALRPVAIPAN